MGFYWQFSVKKDDKGRITIPGEYKEVLNSEYNGCKLAITHGFVRQNCLVVHPDKVWVRKIQKLLKSKEGKKNPRELNILKRYLMSNTYLKQLDNNGKILIPQILWEKIGVNDKKGGREIIIVGNFDSFEIWDAKEWERYNQATKEKIEKSFISEADLEIFEKLDVESITTFEGEYEDQNI